MNAIDGKNLDTAAPVTSEHDAAYRLFQLISETERWWTASEQPPTRDEILDCYAQCVAAARGEAAPADAAPSEAPTPIIDIIPVAERPVHCAARYEASLDLAAATPPDDRLEVIALLEHCDLEA